VFFDFAKAFDLVDHKILLEKLTKQLPEWVPSWIAAYLTDRQQRVKIGTTTTEWKSVEAGVIQGSVLGPVLFLLFIADINDSIPAGVELLKYADDILVYISRSKHNDQTMQAAANGIANWCRANKMKLNSKKCQELKLTTAKNGPIPSTILENGPIDEVYSYKYLGININNDLDWYQQWEHVYAKVKSVPYLLRQLRQLGFREPILINVYRSYVLSHFAYSAPVLASTNNRTMHEMEIFQRRCFRTIGISQASAELKYGVTSVEHHLKKQCANTLKRILSDPTHIITKKLQRTTARPGHPSIFKPNKARTNAYRDNILQSYLRTIRDGCENLYTASTISQATSNISKNKQTTVTCPVCNRVFKNQHGLNIHKSRFITRPTCKQKPKPKSKQKSNNITKIK